MAYLQSVKGLLKNKSNGIVQSIGKKEEHIMKRRWMTVLCAVLFAMLVMTTSDTKAAAETIAWNEGETEVQTEGAFTYYIHPSKDGKEAWIYKIEIKGKKVESLSIPETIRDKTVTRLGCPERGSEEDDEDYNTLFGTYIEPWHHWDGYIKALSSLTSVRLPDTVEVIDQAAFSGLRSLTKIEIPKKVKRIEEYTFYGCEKLKNIVLPEQLEAFENSSLWDCPSLKSIKLSDTNKMFQVKGNSLIRKKDKALIFAATGGKKFTIPGGVKKITSYAFGTAKSPAIHIPASVSEIERGAFNRNPWRENIGIKNVTVTKKNRVFARDGQCIYKKSDKSFAVAIPDKKGELRISKRVKKLTPDISVVNCDTAEVDYLKKVVYPSGLKRVIVPGLTAITARNVYFTGSVPPKVVDPNHEYYGKLPIFCHVYVPKAYENAYKKWYKKLKCYSNVDGWHTYNP